MSLRVLLIVLAVGGGGCRSAHEGGTAGPSAGPWPGDFPAYPGATQAGSQHVAGADMHIQCTLFASTSAPEDVIAFYRARFPDATADGPNELSIRKPNGFVLSVHAADANVPHCGATLKAADRTVVLVSQAIR